MAEVGPDGHVWVIDWYNFIVQHNPTPAGFKTGKGTAYETPLRDKTHGRIYRVVYTKAKPEKPLHAEGRDAREAGRDAQAPQHDLAAARPAAAGGAGKDDVAPALAKLIEDKTVDETGLNAGAVHALRVLGALSDDFPYRAVKHPSEAVRLSALAAMPRNASSGRSLASSSQPTLQKRPWKRWYWRRTRPCISRISRGCGWRLVSP